MARADADARAARDGECTPCHTTWGFLNDLRRRPPEESEPVGIACAACHAAHPERATAVGATCAGALLRDVSVPALLAGAIDARADRSRVCLVCHTPGPGDRAPAASAAAIWAGRGGVDPKSGSPIDGAAPHAAVPGGCIGCHRTGPPELERGSGHAFHAGSTACGVCHAAGRADPSLRRRAEDLWTRLGGSPSSTPHAASTRLDRSTTRGRALWNVALVIEDPAADAHNAPYARRLLDAALAVLEAPEGAERKPSGSARP
jgi:hypothetical protein